MLANFSQTKMGASASKLARGPLRYATVETN